jgi:hypothetical protein
MYGLRAVLFDYLVEFGGGDLSATGVAYTGFLFFGWMSSQDSPFPFDCAQGML